MHTQLVNVGIHRSHDSASANDWLVCMLKGCRVDIPYMFVSFLLRMNPSGPAPEREENKYTRTKVTGVNTNNVWCGQSFPSNFHKCC